MGIDMFICGACQQVFHNIEEFIEHKNSCRSSSVETQSGESQIVMYAAEPQTSAPSANDEATDNQLQINQMAGYQVIENFHVEDVDQGGMTITPIQAVQEIACTSALTVGSSSTGNNQATFSELPSSHLYKQETEDCEAPILQEIPVVEMPLAECGGDPLVEQLVEHHLVHVQNQDGIQQLQIQTAPGHQVEINDIIAALQQGQAITVQDATGIPAVTEIQLVVSGKEDGTTPEAYISDLSQQPSVTAEVSAVPKPPVRRRGRPRKGEEKLKAQTAEPEENLPPKEAQKDAEGKLVCRRCKKKFSKERHFNTHKCLALSDFVDMEKVINIDNEDEEEDPVDKDADFRAPTAVKKRKIQNKGADSSVIILRHPRIKLDLTQPEIPGSEQPGVEQPKLGTITKNEEPLKSEEQEPVNKFLIDGLTIEKVEVVDLVKEGLADFPGAGDIKLSQVRVDDGTEDPKLHEALRAIMEDASETKENQKVRRGRKPKGSFVDIEPASKRVRNLPIFKYADDRLEFEKSANVDLEQVDTLYRQHLIDQDINENAPPAKNRSLDRLSVFSCNVCEKIIMSKSHARLHCITHTNLKPFKCFKCNFCTNTKGNLYSHMRKHTGQLYRCSACTFSTINKGHLIEHEAVHSKERHECEICHKDYSTQKSLYGHVRRKHADTPDGKDYMISLGAGQTRNQAILHQCHVCNRKFKKKIDRDRHMYMHNIKNNPNIFSCGLCNRACSRRVYLEKHLTRHRMIYFCSECDEKFPSTTHLTQHLADVHFGAEATDEETLKERFRKCIECSIYLPEADGSVNFEDEAEEGESLLSAEGDPDPDDSYEEEDILLHTETDHPSRTVQVENAQTPIVTLEHSPDSDNQTVNVENISESVKIQMDVSGGDSEVLASKKTSSIGSSNESEEFTVIGEPAGEQSTSSQSVVGEPASEQSTSSQSVVGEPVGEQSTSGQSVVGEPAGEQSTSSQSVVGEPAGEQSTSLSNAGAEISEDADVDIMRLDKTSNGPVYDKNFFKEMGFKTLNMDIYNRIRQVFGKEECQYCGRLYFSSPDFEQHLRTHTGERPFGCNQCNYKAISKENLKRHIEKDHDKVKFLCNQCGFLGANRSQLWTHAQAHKNPEAYGCPECEQTFALPKQLKSHISASHPDMTEDAVRSATAIQHRERTKIGRKCYKCPHCDRGIFKNAADLQKHIWIHEGVKPFKCPLCPHACRSRNNLASHMIRHSMDKPFLCTECGRAYKSKTALRWHIRSHKDGKFKCLKCPYEATQSSHLKRHMETHDIIKRYVCQHCAYSSNTLGYLKIHYTRNHKGHTFTHSSSVYMNQIPMVRTGPEVDTKIYRCLSCDYLFGNLSDMKRHLKLRHHILMENMNLLDEINMAGVGENSQVLGINTEDSSQSDTMIDQAMIQEDVIHDSEIQIVQLNEPLTEEEMSTEDYVAADDDDEKTQSAVSILQQIIGMSHQVSNGHQEITVKSEDGQSYIVQHEGEVLASDGADLENQQYVIQYVTADGNEVTIREHLPQEQGHLEVVMDTGDMPISKAEVQQQDIGILPDSVEAQNIGNIGIEQHTLVFDSAEAQKIGNLGIDQHAQVLDSMEPQNIRNIDVDQQAQVSDSHVDVTQPLVLNFSESVTSSLPMNIVQIPSLGLNMADGMPNVLTLENTKSDHVQAIVENTGLP